MNKRTRLKRRILRDHRNVHAWDTFHLSCVYREGRTRWEWQWWTCPHCPAAVPVWIPHAYR